MARFEPVRERSILSLEGESSLHPIHTSTDKIEGFFEVGVLKPGSFDLSVPPKGGFEVYVEDLKSDFSYLDRVVQDRLDIRRFPRIRANLIELRPQGDGYAAVGEIVFHGATVRLEDEVDITWLDDTTIEVKGEMMIDVTRFNVQAPKLVSISVESEVKIKLKLILKQVGA
jgi:hypothetical protein